MAKIKVLDKNMINMIAAGEVIERPASVVKEMLENSIDAGAKNIIVKVEDGGKRLISVTDDGCGIAKEDIPIAFEPHATSKIKTVEDLTAIKSMGFRGEALASIGSIAKIRIVSRERGAIEAYAQEIDCSEKGPVMPTSSSYGTTIEVRDIFYKLPARRKFLRASNTEMTHISEQFTRIALANSNIGFTLIHNNRQKYHLLPTDDVISRIRILMSEEIARDLVSIEAQEKDVKIKAYIGMPANARSNNKYQYTFLNGRFIRDKFIIHAIKEAYRGLIEPNKHPVAFLFIEMPYDSYDVNVHPSKIEIRFDNPSLIHSQILSIIKEKLRSMELDVVSSLDNITPHNSNIAAEATISRSEAIRRERIKDAMENFFTKSARPIKTQGKFNFSHQTTSCANTNGYQRVSEKTSIPHYNTNSTQDLVATKSSLLQIHNSYIIYQTPDGFAIVDQHALHERILYEKLCERLVRNQKPLESQKLLIPETIDLTPAQQQVIEDNKDTFDKLGIDIEAFGPRSYALHSFPTLLKDTDIKSFVLDLLDILMDSTVTPDAEKLLHSIMDMAACKAAIKAGKPLSNEEMAQLLKDKELVERSSRCPHGRPTTIKFTIEELEKKFKRTGF